jgi:two-component system KDP operon response regulator KdpE
VDVFARPKFREQRLVRSSIEIQHGKHRATGLILLRLFVRHSGGVLTHRYILREIWGPKSEEHRQYLRVYVTHLRQKIEPNPTKPSLIQTQPGIGYRFTG